MSSETVALSRKSGLVHLFAGPLAGITVGLIFHRISDRFFYPFIPPPATIGIAIVILAAGIAAGIRQYIFPNHGEAGKLRKLVDAVFAYGVALDLALFGFQKVFGMQFVVPVAMLDEPFSRLSGDSLTWAYFGHSYPYTVCLAIVQIAGALLLSSKRTRLLGTLVLIPVLVNIVLIDYFFSLPLPVMIHAILLLVACCYFAVKNITIIKGLFLASERKINWLTTGSLLVIPLLLVASVFKNPSPYGKFGTSSQHAEASNHYADSLNRQKDGPPTTIYFDYNNELVFEFDDYRQRFYGTYSLQGDSISIRWHYPPDAPKWSGVLLFREGGVERIRGTLGAGVIDVRLSRERLSGIRFRDF